MTGSKKWEEMGKKLKANKVVVQQEQIKIDDEVKEVTEQKKELITVSNGALTIADPGMLAEISNMGMKGVDQTDILPPYVCMVNSATQQNDMQDKEGKHPLFGQYYHSGNKIYDQFDAYIVWANKIQMVDKNHKGEVFQRNEQGEPLIPAYRVIAVMDEDMSLFSMKFKKTAYYALSSLFSISKSSKKPMFGFLVHFENAKRTRTKNGQVQTWYVPVLRVKDFVTDASKFDELYQIASKYDKKNIAEVKVVDEDTATPEDVEAFNALMNGEPH